MKQLTYEQKLQKMKERAEKKEKRLLKRLELAKSKPKKEKISLLLRRCQKVTNAIVRVKYQGGPCYTCEKPIPKGDEQAGHCWTVQGHPYSRFDFRNLRLQGSCCNNYKHGYHSMFAHKLRNELGEESWNNLVLTAKSSLRYSREELLQMIEDRKKLLESLTQNPNV